MIMVVVMIIAMWRKLLFFKLYEALALLNGVLHEKNLLFYCFLYLDTKGSKLFPKEKNTLYVIFKKMAPNFPLRYNGRLFSKQYISRKRKYFQEMKGFLFPVNIRLHFVFFYVCFNDRQNNGTLVEVKIIT